VKPIYVEPCGIDPRVFFITRGGIFIGEDRTIQRNIAEESGIKKDVEKTQDFNARKERQIFKEARSDFNGNQGSSSKTRP
jgi:hypothetical protein